MFDLGDPKLSIQYSGPWSTSVFENYRRKIDAFASYGNTFAFLAGNEVVFQPGESISASFVKAAVRDTKAYIKAKGYNIPVGYAGADVPAQPKMMDYLNCQSVEDSVDFYGLNSYSWCGESNMEASNFNSLLQYSSYSVPFLFTEYGCNSAGSPRPFTEILSIYGPDLENVLSGAIVFEFHQEWNLYGLVNISSNGERTLLPDYYSYQTQIKKVNPNRLKMSEYTKTYPLQNCPAVTEPNNLASAYNWLSAAYPLPPTPNNDECQCMYQQSKCRTNKSFLDFTVESRPYRDAIENYKLSICPGENCYPVGVAPQYGVYGVWSMCNPYEQLTFAMNVYYEQGHGCDHTTIPAGISQEDSYAGANCTALPLNYNSYSLVYPAADPITGEPITNPGNNCVGGQQLCGETCYNPQQSCCVDNSLSAGKCTGTSAGTGPSSTGSAPTGPVTTSGSNSPTTSGNNAAVTENDTPRTSSAEDTDIGSVGTSTVERAQSNAESMMIPTIMLLSCVLAMI